LNLELFYNCFKEAPAVKSADLELLWASVRSVRVEVNQYNGQSIDISRMHFGNGYSLYIISSTRTK